MKLIYLYILFNFITRSYLEQTKQTLSYLLNENQVSQIFEVKLQNYCYEHEILSVPYPGIVTTDTVTDDFCTLTLDVRNVSRIEVNFIEFNIDYKLDFLAIKNEDNTKVIRKYYGNKLPPTFVTQNNTFTFSFQKITKSTSKYIKFNFTETTLNSSYYDNVNREFLTLTGEENKINGTFINFTYSNNIETVWNINFESNCVTYITGFNFSTEEHYDKVTIGRGDYLNNKTIIHEISGNHSFIFFSIPYSQIWIAFTTDETILSNDFVLKVACQARIYINESYTNKSIGFTASPNYPNQYLPNQRLMWKIQLPENKPIQLTIVDIDLDEKANDYIIIGYGNLLMKEKFYPVSGNTSKNKVFVSTSNAAYIYLVSNAPTRASRGFNITWRPVVQLGPNIFTTSEMTMTNPPSPTSSYEQMMNTLKVVLHRVGNISDESIFMHFQYKMSDFVTSFCIENEKYCLMVEIVTMNNIVIEHRENVNGEIYMEFFVKSMDESQVVMSAEQLKEMIEFYSKINFLETWFGYNISVISEVIPHQNWMMPSLIILAVIIIFFVGVWLYVEVGYKRINVKKKSSDNSDMVSEEDRYVYSNPLPSNVKIDNGIDNYGMSFSDELVPTENVPRVESKQPIPILKNPSNHPNEFILIKNSNYPHTDKETLLSESNYLSPECLAYPYNQNLLSSKLTNLMSFNTNLEFQKQSISLDSEAEINELPDNLPIEINETQHLNMAPLVSSRSGHFFRKRTKKNFVEVSEDVSTANRYPLSTSNEKVNPFSHEFQTPNADSKNDIIQNKPVEFIELGKNIGNENMSINNGLHSIEKSAQPSPVKVNNYRDSILFSLDSSGIENPSFIDDIDL